MSSAIDEADALAALLGSDVSAPAIAPGAVSAEVAPAPAAMVDNARPAWRLPGSIVASLALVLALPFAAGAMADWPPLPQAAGVAAALAAIAWLAARAAGLRLSGWGARPVRASGIGAALGLAGICWCVLALAAGGRLVPDGATACWELLVGLAATAAQVAGEEVFFRGWLQPALGRLARPVLAIGGSAILFSALHLVGGARAILSLVNILLAGLLFGLLAWRSGGLAMPIAAHLGWNAGETLGLGLDPNPGSGPWGAIRGYDIVGAAVWGGGEEGLNDSLIATLVLGGLVLAVLGARRGQLA